MPDSAGKRQRREVKARKAAAIEERRLARNQRREDRANGLIVEDPLDLIVAGEAGAETSEDPSDGSPDGLETDADRDVEPGDAR